MTGNVRLVRLVRIEDAPRIAELVRADVDRYSPWLPKRPDEYYTAHGQRNVIGELLTTYDKGGCWPGVIVVDDNVVGQIAISTILRGPFHKGFLGYWISSGFQGNGHTGRAVAEILRIADAELRLHRVEAHTQLDNLASQAILKKHGFTPWGIAHRHFFADGQWHDEIFWERELG